MTSTSPLCQCPAPLTPSCFPSCLTQTVLWSQVLRIAQFEATGCLPSWPLATAFGARTFHCWLFCQSEHSATVFEEDLELWPLWWTAQGLSFKWDFCSLPAFWEPAGWSCVLFTFFSLVHLSHVSLKFSTTAASPPPPPPPPPPPFFLLLLPCCGFLKLF